MTSVRRYGADNFPTTVLDNSHIGSPGICTSICAFKHSGSEEQFGGSGLFGGGPGRQDC